MLARIRIVIAAAIFSSLIAGCQNTANEGRTAPMGKPSAPLTVRIEPDEEKPQPGQIVDFRISASSPVPVPELELSVDVPDELAVYSGDQYWLGPLPAGGRHELVLAIRIPEEPGQRITATAVARFEDGQAMSAMDVYLLGREQPGSAAPESRDTIHDGQTIREYQLP